MKTDVYVIQCSSIWWGWQKHYVADYEPGLAGSATYVNDKSAAMTFYSEWGAMLIARAYVTDFKNVKIIKL